MSITLYVLQPQEPLCCSVLLACRDLEKKPLALAVESKDVTVVTGTLTMHDSISMSWFLHILFFPLKGEWIHISMDLSRFINLLSKLGLQSTFCLPAVPYLHVLLFFFFSTWHLHFKKHLRVPAVNTWQSHTCMSEGAMWDKAVIFFLYIYYYNRTFLITSMDLVIYNFQL